MLKNRYYCVNLKSEKERTFLIRVKKDFYTEGIIVNEDTILQGYFDFYRFIYLNILDSGDLKSRIDNHKGIIGDFEEGLAYTYLDEDLISYDSSDKIDANLVEIADKELIDKIDFLIRSGVRNLSSNNRQIYDFFNQRRQIHYKELKSEAISPIHNLDGTEYIAINDPQFDFTREDLSEIGQYLQSLNQKQIVKGRDENGKKIRRK